MTIIEYEFLGKNLLLLNTPIAINDVALILFFLGIGSVEIKLLNISDPMDGSLFPALEGAALLHNPEVEVHSVELQEVGKGLFQHQPDL